jgi:hypothetical protein
MVYFYLQRSPIPFVITALLALTTTEYAVIMVALFAGTVIWEYFATERPRSLLPYIILPLVLAAVWVAYLQSVALIPTYTFATVNNQAYTFTGSSAFLNPVAILANPVYSFSYALPAKLLYLTLVFGPFLLLSVRTPRWLLPAAPWILVVLFFSPLVQAGGIGAVYQIWSQWSSFLIPFVVISAIVTFGRVTRRERAAKAEPVRSGRRIFAAMAVTMAIVVVAAGAFSPFLPQTSLSIGDGIVPTDVAAGALWHGVWPTPVVNAPEVDRFISLIPGSYSVLTQNQIGSKLGERIAPVYIFFQPGSAPVETDAILVDTQLAGFCSSCLTQTLLNGDYLIYAADPAAGITLYFEVG